MDYTIASFTFDFISKRLLFRIAFPFYLIFTDAITHILNTGCDC